MSANSQGGLRCFIRYPSRIREYRLIWDRLYVIIVVIIVIAVIIIDIGEIVSQRFETFLSCIHNSLRATTFPSPVSLTIRCDRIFEI